LSQKVNPGVNPGPALCTSKVLQTSKQAAFGAWHTAFTNRQDNRPDVALMSETDKALILELIRTALTRPAETTGNYRCEGSDIERTTQDWVHNSTAKTSASVLPSGDVFDR